MYKIYNAVTILSFMEEMHIVASVLNIYVDGLKITYV